MMNLNFYKDCKITCVMNQYKMFPKVTWCLLIFYSKFPTSINLTDLYSSEYTFTFNTYLKQLDLYTK